jgi:alkylated DNA repair dioxygenase AlkB
MTNEHNIEGLYIIPDFITELEEETLKRSVDAGQWSGVSESKNSRRVQHYGYKYVYTARYVNPSIGKLPDWSTTLENKICDIPIVKQLQSTRPNQLIVNEYRPSQGIGAHIDAKIFADPVVTISSGSTCIFEMTKGTEKVELLLHPRTCVVLSGDSRWNWKHCIPARMTDRYDGKDYKRTRRISYTYRWVSK